MNLTKVTTMRLAAGCAAVTLLLIPAPAQSLGSVLKDGVLAPRKQAPPQAPPAARPSAPQPSTRAITAGAPGWRDRSPQTLRQVPVRTRVSMNLPPGWRK